jgi:hypothetical protein
MAFFGRENIGALGRLVCFRKDWVVGDSRRRFRSPPGTQRYACGESSAIIGASSGAARPDPSRRTISRQTTAANVNTTAATTAEPENLSW